MYSKLAIEFRKMCEGNDKKVFGVLEVLNGFNVTYDIVIRSRYFEDVMNLLQQTSIVSLGTSLYVIFYCCSIIIIIICQGELLHYIIL